MRSDPFSKAESHTIMSCHIMCANAFPPLRWNMVATMVINQQNEGEETRNFRLFRLFIYSSKRHVFFSCDALTNSHDNLNFSSIAKVSAVADICGIAYSKPCINTTNYIFI
ncbi:hypothetical protein, unlikely [Trypanosoma brucei brucei TREU927]|uniref:Uncharacterized protein n=1 Tax=Trypanosoma brucei brucei (strain 927/4 GUTat10.1) TaxID=185431 RepID=Q4GY60_TRYB2|nr:hypothetical protein, unlikely [Trypanosoma brucei brucei TREU927]CAJ16727.1 hypothetical protein, unlikely [Trypanosoma brucei brucei TREU927]